jgi:hypothetical protein
VGWFSGRGELVAVAGACERDPRLQRLCRRSEDDDVILEMVLQQFGLGACGTDGDGGGGVGVDCSDEGWSVEHLRGILFSAAAAARCRRRRHRRRREQHRRPPGQQQK